LTLVAAPQKQRPPGHLAGRTSSIQREGKHPGIKPTLLAGAAAGALIAAWVAKEPPSVAADDAEVAPQAAYAVPNWTQAVPAAIASGESMEPPLEGESIAPPVSLDALLDEIQADSTPDGAEIDRQVLKAEILSDPALREHFARSR